VCDLARVSEQPADPSSQHASSDHLSYEAFGRLFVETAVSAARVASSVAEIAGDAVTIGPMPAGPGDVARVTAVGRVGTVTAERLDVTADHGDAVAFAASVPFTMELDVDLGGQHHRYRAELVVPLRLVARPAAPLRLVIEVVPPRSREVRVKVEAKGLQAKVVGRAGNIEAQVAIHAARYVREQLEQAQASSATSIDLAELVEQTWPA